MGWSHITTSNIFSNSWWNISENPSKTTLTNWCHGRINCPMSAERRISKTSACPESKRSYYVNTACGLLINASQCTSNKKHNAHEHYDLIPFMHEESNNFLKNSLWIYSAIFWSISHSNTLKFQAFPRCEFLSLEILLFRNVDRRVSSRYFGKISKLKKSLQPADCKLYGDFFKLKKSLSRMGDFTLQINERLHMRERIFPINCSSLYFCVSSCALTSLPPWKTWITLKNVTQVLSQF